MKSKKNKEITVDTSTESVLHIGGDFPVGHITGVVKHYDMIFKTFTKLNKNMKERIKALEVNIEALEKDDAMINKVNIIVSKAVLNELKLQLIDVDAWWDASMETHKPNKRWYDNKETCQHLRPFG